jgi:hypothetical protein
MKRERKPSWWKLNCLMLVILAVLFLITVADLSRLARQLLEAGVVVAGYGMVGAWVYGNADELEAEAQRKKVEERQPWHPSWWRPELNSQQYHYLLIKYGMGSPESKESPE